MYDNLQDVQIIYSAKQLSTLIHIICRLLRVSGVGSSPQSRKTGKTVNHGTSFSIHFSESEEMSQDEKKFLCISDLLVTPDAENEKAKRATLARYAEEERERVKRRMGGFDWKTSIAWQELTAQFGNKLSHDELISIAELVSVHARLKLDRDAKRRKTVLIKWFQEHWMIIYPILGMIRLKET